MRKGKKIAVAKKATAAFLTAAMVTGMLPAGQIQNVMAADDSPYVISTGRMGDMASSSVGNSDPLCSKMDPPVQDGKVHGMITQSGFMLTWEKLLM